MAIDARVINATEDTTLDAVLDAANDVPVTVERNGVSFTITRLPEGTDEDIWKDYDPQAVIDMLEEFRNSPMEGDADQWIADVYRFREEGSRPDGHP